MILGALLAATIFLQEPQNIIVILADDMGFASLHAEHPDSGLPTPHLDQLAAQGMSFTDAHSPSAVCSPTRYGLLTGRYPWRTTLKSGIVNKWGTPLIAEDRLTIADVARQAGRTTSCIGKWHLGWQWPKQGGGFTRSPAKIDYTRLLGGGPLAAGFDHAFGDDVPNWPPYVWIENNRALSVPTGTMPEEPMPGVRAGPMTPGWSLEAVLPELTRQCVTFLRDRAEKEEPFFLFYSMTSPHTPIVPSEEFVGKSGVSKYADFILETDGSVGQILLALDQTGLADNTLVIFTADNGTSPKGDFASLEAGGVDLRGQWRGHKADIWEGGHRVPFLVRWPGVVAPGSQCDEPILLTDIMPTVAEALGQTLPEDAAEDGQSLLPLLRGQSLVSKDPRTLVMQSSQGYFAVRSGQWKACFSAGSAGWSAPNSEKKALDQGLPPVQLYDMAADPGETTNLAVKPRQHRQQVEILRGLLLREVHRTPLDTPTWWKQLPWPKPPNIVLFFADDAGYADFGFQGSTTHATPHVDSIAANGIRFTQGYVSASVCSPSRAGMLTGRYQQRFGHESNLPGMADEAVSEELRGLPLSETTLADLLQRHGYTTGLVGKWHLGLAPRFHPTQRGFDEFFGMLEGSSAYAPGKAKRIQSSRGEVDPLDLPYLTDAFGDEAVAFVDRHHDESFFLYLSFNAPHTPMQARPEDLAAMRDSYETEVRAANAAMTKSLDDNVGKVLAALDRHGLTENTLVIFLNDNGGAMPYNASLNAPLRGTKGTCLEGGIRVPFCMQWPAKFYQGGVEERPIVSLDLFPTVLAAAGIPIPENLNLDGVNLLPFLVGGWAYQVMLPHETLFWKLNWGAAVRHEDWKLVRTPQGEEWLFNLAEDPGERHDRSDQYPERVQALQTLLQSWENELPTPIWQTAPRWKVHSSTRYDQTTVDGFIRR